MPNVMMDEARRGVEAREKENDRRDGAMHVRDIVRRRFGTGIERRNGEEAKKTITAYAFEELTKPYGAPL
jgi:hypothetical protein